MTSPRRAEATAKGRYYTHPETGELLVSVTNAISVGVAKPALIPWAAKVVGDKAAELLPRLVATSRTRADCRDDRGPRARAADDCLTCWACTLREVKREVTVARDKAADLGLRIHELADAHATGKPIAWQDGDDEAGEFVAQYRRFLAEWGVDLDRDIVAAEMTVAAPGCGYAGTLDLIVALPLGITEDGLVEHLAGGERRPWMVDLKTSSTRPVDSIYPEYALQLTGLSGATEWWMPDDSTIEAQSVEGCAVLNLRRNDYALIPVPCGASERAAFQAVVEIARWSHSDPIASARPVAPAGSTPRPTRTRRKAA